MIKAHRGSDHGLGHPSAPSSSRFWVGGTLAGRSRQRGHPPQQPLENRPRLGPEEPLRRRRPVGTLHHIRRKGKKVTRELLLAKPAREALDRYLAEVRGRATGPLIQSQSGQRLAPQNIDDALKKIAAQANAILPAGEHIHLSAHLLRHTALRKAAEKEDIRYAMKLSGHTSSKYIWRYTEPSRAGQERALEELF
jgi:hypothetical protein